MGILDAITGRAPDVEELLTQSPDTSGNGYKQAEPAPYSRDRALTAAAKRIDLSDPDDAKEAADAPWRTWQLEAWESFENVPEIHYGYEMLAAVMSRMRLYPAVVLDPDSPPSSVSQIQKHRREQESEDNGDDVIGQHELPDDLTDEVMEYMTQLVAELGSGYGGISGLLRMFTLNISMPGECYLALIDKRWSIRSTSEIRVMQSTEQPILTESRISNSATGQPWRYLPKSTPLIRIYRQHPRFSREPVSSVMSVLESVAELRAIQQMIRGIARSRMNAGIIFIPDDLRVAGQSVDRDVEATEDETEDLLDEMFDAFTAPITNETAGTSAVPLAITGPRESGEAIRWITFERQSDQWLVKRADDALIRVLNGLNFPKEKVEGLSQVRYCVDDETEILTRDGWKTHDRVSVGDEVLTLNPDTEASEWQPLEDVSTFEIDEPVLEMSRRGHHSVSTLDHRWYVRRQTTRGGKAFYDRQVVTSSDLGTNHFIPIAAPSAELPVEPKYSDAFVELVAWYFTEGYVKEKGQRMYDTCVDREGFIAWLTAKRKEAGLSRAKLGFAMGDYASRESAAQSMAHLEKAGAVDPQVRHRLVEVLGADPAEIEEFFHSGGNLLSHIVITKSEATYPEDAARIRRALTTLCGPAGVERGSGRPQWSEATNAFREGQRAPGRRIKNGHDTQKFYLNGLVAAPILDVCPGKDKVVDLSFIHELTAAQLELFITTAIDADGHWRDDAATIPQRIPERLDALELACILSGRAVHRYIDARGFPTLKIKKRAWIHPMGHGNNSAIRPYQGTVWCPTVRHGTWLARRSGTVYFTMNTNASIVDDDLFRIHVEPLAVMLCDAVTTAYMRYRVRQKFPDLSEQTLARVVTWYDPSNIIVKTDPADSANEGYDRKLVSGAAWRRRHGFSETDAPSQSEVALRTVIDEIGKNLPPERQDFLLQQAFPALFGESAVVPGGSPLPARQPAQDDRFGPNDAMTTSEQSGGSDDGPVKMSD